MLVLSRREDQQILFPNLGITVEVLAIKGKNVRLGVIAPRSVRVLRNELADSEPPVDAFKSAASRLEKINGDNITSEQRHAMRNRLNTASLAIHVASKQLAAGICEAAESTLQKAICNLQELDEQLSFNDTKTIGIQTDRKLKTLLVEDDANERELMAGILQMSGFEVVSVEDGVAAIEYLEQNESPDVVLMDMRMPRLSGPETISEIRKHAKHAGLKIFGVSGMDFTESRIPMGASGVTGWFCKPIDPKQLVSQLRDQITRTTENPETSLLAS